MHRLHPHVLRLMGRTRGSKNCPLPHTDSSRAPLHSHEWLKLTSAGTRQRRCRELLGEEVLCTGEGESRPPKREQGSSEPASAAAAALPFPFPRHLSTTR